MSNLKPINREESILSGADLTPINRKEYFLKMASKSGEGDGGGSSLPPFTGSDEGKVLTVSVKDSVMTETVIIPEQTVTASDFNLFSQFNNMYTYVAPLTSSFPTTDLYDGCKAIIDIANQRYDVVFASLDDDPGPIGMFEVEEFTVGVFTDHYELMILINAEMSDDFSLTLSLYTSVPEVEPKWEKSDYGYKVLRVTDFREESQGVYYFSINMTYEEIENCFKSEIPTPLYLFIPYFTLDYSTKFTYETPAYNSMCLLERLGQNFEYKAPGYDHVIGFTDDYTGEYILRIHENEEKIPQ